MMTDPVTGAQPTAPSAETPRERAVLDSAHVGDIQGAFGTLGQNQQNRRGLRSRALALMAIIGPGLIVMVGDNDAGGVATYSQAGQNYGTSLLWVLLLLVPVLIVNQEMVVRLGAVTGVGHAKLINERFGRFWGWFSVGDLFLLNFLTIVTEFIGVSLALGYFGVSKYVAVPIAAVGLIAMTASGSFRFWERSMFVFVFANLLVVPLFFFAHPSIGNVAEHFVIPGIHGGRTRPRSCSSSAWWGRRSRPGSSSFSSPTSSTSGSRRAGSTMSGWTPGSVPSSSCSAPRV